MKAIFALAMVLVSTSAFAQNVQQRIDLKAGSEVRMRVGQTTVVSCEGSSEGSASAGSRCKVIKNVYGTMEVYNGQALLSSQSTLDGALEVVKKLREAGLCD